MKLWWKNDEEMIKYNEVRMKNEKKNEVMVKNFKVMLKKWGRNDKKKWLWWKKDEEMIKKWSYD